MTELINNAEHYWETKSLSEMTKREWESLCDGCGKCCLIKLQDEETEQIHYTAAVCRYLEQDKCHCTVYEERKTLVPECVKLTPANLASVDFMPQTCAYRLLHEGKSLPDWHPLLTGNRARMDEAGHTVTGKIISEEYIHPDELEEHIITWVE